MAATSAVAQVNTNLPLEQPAPAIAASAPVPAAEAKTNAPAKKIAVKHKKKAVLKAPTKAADKKISETAALAAPLVAGPATVAADNVNLRGQAGLKGEVVGHVKKGDTVTVIAPINLDKPAAEEPAHWAKINLPTGTKVWVNSQFIDATNRVVSAKKLNMRGGPGENFSVLGVLEKGAAITAISTKGEWIQIEPPTSAFAFVAANLLKQEAPAPTVQPMPALPPAESVPPTPSTVPEMQPIVAQAAPPVLATAPVVTLAPLPAPAPAMETNVPVADTNPPPPRIVTHEGNVRSSVSIVAPTYYELYDPASGKAINYLFSSTTNLDLGRYEGLHINVTGEEGLEARWKDTPVLTVQKIYVLSTNAPAKKAKFHLW